MNELISNLFVLIPLAFLIAIRILQSRAQRKAGVKPTQPAYPKRISQGERPFPGAPTSIREKRPFYPMAQEVATEIKQGEFVSAEEELPPYVPPRMVVPEEPVSMEKERKVAALKAETKPASFPEKIAKLSPWKQAVVLREILGPPKGW